MKFKVSDILEITGGELLTSSNTSGLFSISTDTRTLSPEEVFLPIVGANFDGHGFINTAIDKGCRGFFIDKDHQKQVPSFKRGAKFIIVVEDTVEAYLKLANYYKRKVSPITVGITGSSGKTTTKEMIFSILSKSYKTHKSKLNHNNEIGLCQTMLSMPENTEFLVVEMGMRALGEIELLSTYAEPDIAVITNVGTAHLGRLGSIENIAKAKCEIINHLNKEGTLIALDQNITRENVNWNGKTVFYNPAEAKILELTDKNSKFIYKDREYELSVPGEYNIINALAAIETGIAAGISYADIKNALFEYKPIDNRGKIIELENGSIIINDSYNANPDSMKASIKSVISSYSDKKIVLVLGDMAELGEREADLHRGIGEFLNDKKVYEVLTVGEKAKFILDSLKNDKIKTKSFTQTIEAVEYLKSHMEKDAVILLKASRCMAFEKIAESFERVRG